MYSDDSDDASYASTWDSQPRDIPEKFRDIRARIDSLYRSADDHEAAFRALRDEYRALFEARRAIHAKANTLLHAIEHQSEAEMY